MKRKYSYFDTEKLFEKRKQKNHANSIKDNNTFINENNVFSTCSMNKYSNLNKPTLSSQDILRIREFQCFDSKYFNNHVQKSINDNKLDNSTLNTQLMKCPMHNSHKMNIDFYSYNKIANIESHNLKEISHCPYVNFRELLSKVSPMDLLQNELSPKLQSCLHCKRSHSKCSGWPNCDRCKLKKIPCYASNFHQMLCERIDIVSERISKRFFLDLFLPEELLKNIELNNEKELVNLNGENSLFQSPQSMKIDDNAWDIAPKLNFLENNDSPQAFDDDNNYFISSIPENNANNEILENKTDNNQFILINPPSFHSVFLSNNTDEFFDKIKLLPRTEHPISSGYDLINMYYNTDAATSVWIIEQEVVGCPVTGNSCNEIRNLILCNDAFSRMLCTSKSNLLKNEQSIHNLKEFTYSHIQKWYRWMPHEHLDPYFYGNIKVCIGNRFYLQKFERIYNLIFCVHIQIPYFDDEIILNGKVYPKSFYTVSPLTFEQSQTMVEKMKLIMTETLQRCLEKLNIHSF